jgi:2-polyprenyl-3-methyl-5-hydroxy-6-metoxy-1,4-benzoquinol methylase
MKQTPAHDKYNDTIFSLLCELKPKNVVEVGCMRGSLAAAYFQIDKDCNWIGIDIDQENIEYAKKSCSEAIILDIEKMSDDDYFKYKNADIWIFGDVLEHLYNPWALLAKIRLNCKENVKILACIPNSQHWNFQARINSGMIQYENDGLFDRTHIRFFSKVTMIELFEGNNFLIEKMISRSISFPGFEKYMPFIRGMAEASGMDPNQVELDSKVFQYVIQAS